MLSAVNFAVRVTKLTLLMMGTVGTCCVCLFVGLFIKVITKVSLCGKNLSTIFTAVNRYIFIYWQTLQRAPYDLHTLYEERTRSKYFPF